MEKGFYKEAGLEVTIKQGRPGMDFVEEVVSGRADFGVEMPEILIARNQGKPVVVLAAIFQHSPQIILARADSGIRSPHDLIGKKLMWRFDSAAELRAMLANEDVSLEKINFMELTWDINDLIFGNVDAISAYVTAQPFDLEKAGIESAILSPVNYGIDFYGDCLFTSERELAEYPSRVKAFRDASLRGWAYAMDHPEELMSIIRKKYRAECTLEYMQNEFEHINQLMLPKLVEIGHMNPGRWKHIGATFVKLGMLDPDYSLDGFLYDSYLQPDDYAKIKKIVWVLLSVIALIFISAILLLVFNRKLKKEVLERTGHLESEIAERKQAEEALHENQIIFQSFLENSPVYIFFKDHEIRSLMLSRNYEQMLGMPLHDIIGKTMDDLFPSDLAKSMIVDDKRILNKGETVTVVEELAGRTYETTKFPISIDQKTNMLAGFTVDITDRKKAEQDLQKSEEKFRNILENLMDVYFETTIEGIIQYCSPSAEVFSGYTIDELIGNKVAMFYHNMQDRQRLLEELSKNGHVREFEILFKKKDGGIYDVSINADIYYDENGQPAGMTGTIRDITQQKKLKEQLYRSRKMESLGLMASGIAHDLNNILSGIVSYPELLLMQLPEGSPMKKPLETIYDSGRRAADVVADLLTVARGVTSKKEVLNLNAIILEHLQSGEHQKLGQNYPGIVVKKELDPDLLHIRCSSPHMKKILMNLLGNASDAIEHKGTITIKTANRYLDKSLAGYEDIQKGEYVLLSVSDTGSGISEEDMNKIFEPFYTKKVMGRRGTGLGLAVVWNTVQDHDGYINVSSSETGTVFDLYFPVTRDELTADAKTLPMKDYLGNGEKILVIDDEKNQREIACALLTQLGYSAESVSSGEEAVRYLEQNAADLIVLDMIMSPGINGRQTYKRILKKINPKQKAIIASGFAETEDVKETLKAGAGAFIKKPYILEKFGTAIRDELKKE
ncbi:MAG: ABC transporter substrate-binding protein [Desulfobulbaceae bacterium]|nr:ABC transporter substrate-binding protein [Desulfobulbaceae bacterium]